MTAPPRRNTAHTLQVSWSSRSKMSDELILELIAAIKAAIADSRGELTPKNLRRRLWAASIVAARGNDDNVGDECHKQLRDKLRAIGEKTRASG